MFKQPRPKKSLLPPPNKKRKAVHNIEEISFDRDARTEYLTGFHKRKVQRQKHAQEIAAEKARQERIEMRKQLREERQQAMEEHVNQVKDILKQAERAGQEDGESEDASEDEAWDGFEDSPALEPVDQQQEYIDEDLYTTVTVESVSVDRQGLHKPTEDEDESNHEARNKRGSPEGDSVGQDKKQWPKKTKKKKFRYETKLERQITDRKLKAKKAKYSK